MEEFRGLIASPLGFLIGVSLGALGGGGSILAVPALVYAAGQQPRAATTTSLLVVGLTALSSMVTHLRAGRVRVGTGLVFAAVGTAGSTLGTMLNRSVDPQVLLLAFAGVMVIAAWRMWVGNRKLGAGAAPDPTGTQWTTETITKIVIAGSFVGFLTGFFGVGGGFVIVPALVLALRLPMPEAVGTSLLVIGLNSAYAFAGRVGTVGVEWRVALPFLVAGLLGSAVGKRIADRLPAATLTRAFVGLLVVVAAYTAARSAFALLG